MEGFNIYTLSKIQHFYRWQPHLPFFPIRLPEESWAGRYQYTYRTLPIVRQGPSWALDTDVAERWLSHVTFFKTVIIKWRNHFTRAPMSVKYVPDIANHQLLQAFDTEEKARRSCWFYRTLIFEMFAEFAYLSAAKPNWRQAMIAYCNTNNVDWHEDWFNEVENVLCDFKHTKRAGVIIDVAARV